MSSPAWLNDGFAALMAAVAAYSLGRLVAARAWSRPTHPDVDLAHVLMGTAMVGMLVPDLDPVPAGPWEVVFTGLALWFVWRCIRFVTQRGVEGRDEDHVHHLSHYLTHLVMASSMLYMYLAAGTTGPGVGGGMAMEGAHGSTSEVGAIPLLFVVVLFTSGVWELDGIERFAPRARPAALAGTGGGSPPGPDWPVGTGPPSQPAAGSRGTDHRWLAPRLEAGCHIAMCVTMGFMLVLML